MPEQLWGPFRINAEIRDRNGVVVLKIKDNIFETSTSAWDVDATRGNNGRITVRSAQRQIDILLRPEAPNRLVFERLTFAHRGTKVWLDANDSLSVSAPDGSKIIAGANIFVQDCAVGFRVGVNSVELGTGAGTPEWVKPSYSPVLQGVPYLGSYLTALKQYRPE